MTIGKSKSSRLSSLNYKCDECFPIVNVPYMYFSNNIPESPAYGVFVSQWYVMLGFVQNMKIFCSEDLFWFKFIEAGIFYTETSDYFFENDMVVIQTLLTNVTLLYITYAEWFVHQLWHMTGFRLLLNCDWYHMWGRKCSLFKEHLISLSVGGSWFHPITIYTLHNLSV